MTSREYSLTNYISTCIYNMVQEIDKVMHNWLRLWNHAIVMTKLLKILDEINTSLGFIKWMMALYHIINLLNFSVILLRKQHLSQALLYL